jgi:hypothetical protein
VSIEDLEACTLAASACTGLFVRETERRSFHVSNYDLSQEACLLWSMAAFLTEEAEEEATVVENAARRLRTWGLAARRRIGSMESRENAMRTCLGTCVQEAACEVSPFLLGEGGMKTGVK